MAGHSRAVIHPHSHVFAIFHKNKTGAYGCPAVRQIYTNIFQRVLRSPCFVKFKGEHLELRISHATISIQYLTHLRIDNHGPFSKIFAVKFLSNSPRKEIPIVHPNFEQTSPLDPSKQAPSMSYHNLPRILLHHSTTSSNSIYQIHLNGNLTFRYGHSGDTAARVCI